MFGAMIPALILQCGITVAATVIIFFTPTVGMGCRSLGYLIYGGLAIVIMFLAILSTIFARISETRDTTRSPSVKYSTALIAIILRRFYFSLALINATGLIVMSCFQFSRFLANCYCNASVIGRGTGSYVTIGPGKWITVTTNSRIAGTVLSAVSMATYMIFIALVTSPPKGY